MFNQYLLQVTKTKWLMKFYPFTVIHVVSLAKLSCLYFNLKFEPILIVLTVNIFLMYSHSKKRAKFSKQIYSKRVQLLISTNLILKKKIKQQKSHIKQGKSHPKTKEKLLTKRQVHSITLQGLNCPPLRGSQHLYPSINHHCRQQALQAPAQTMISPPNP